MDFRLRVLVQDKQSNQLFPLWEHYYLLNRLLEPMKMEMFQNKPKKLEQLYS